MKTVAIIAEYNPFHSGHKYQIDRVRDILGEDTAIVAVMSGNFTQRGEIAIMDKSIRARAAVDCGVDLVLELPFPFSMTSAEHYAMSGVTIADSLGVVDHIAFGSECGDIGLLTEVMENTESEEYLKRLEELSSDPATAALGHASLSTRAYRDIFGDGATVLEKPNNVLAIEYLRALKRLNSRLTPITVKREGAGYNDAFFSETSFQSAGAIREMLHKNDNSALEYVPENARNVYYNAISSGELTSTAPLDAAVISYLRLNPPTDVEYHDCAGGLNYRLWDASLEANTISSLIGLAQTKKYTAARIRRAVFNSYFGVTSSEILCYPRYTQVLAMNAKGASILKKAKKMTKIAVITKPSSYTEYGEDVARQKLSSVKADSVFALTVGGGRSGRTPLTFTPYVKK